MYTFRPVFFKPSGRGVVHKKSSSPKGYETPEKSLSKTIFPLAQNRNNFSTEESHTWETSLFSGTSRKHYF